MRKGISMRAFVPLMFFVLLVVFLWIGLYHDPHKLPSALINKAIPNFKLTTVTDKNQFLQTNDLTGKVSLVNVWATWCRACREEHEFLMELAKRDDVIIYGLDYKDKRPQAVAWLRSFGNPYKKSGFDEAGLVGIDWGVYGTPETFVVDAKGVVRYKHIGPLTEVAWREAIQPVIKKLRGS